MVLRATSGVCCVVVCVTYDLLPTMQCQEGGARDTAKPCDAVWWHMVMCKRHSVTTCHAMAVI